MLIIKDASKVLRKDDNRKVYVDEDRGGNLDRNTKLLNTRKEGLYSPNNLSALVTNTGVEYIVPQRDLKKYTSGGLITSPPDEGWEAINWLRTSTRESAVMIRDEFVVHEKFDSHHKDTPITRTAKRALNPHIPLTFRVESKDDKRRIKERIKEIRNNSISEKQFFNLMKLCGFKVHMTVWRKTMDREEGISEIIV